MDNLEWLENFGEIVPSHNGEYFWMIPAVFAFRQNYCIESPWFLSADETWRLVIMPNGGLAENDRLKDWFGLFLWKKHNDLSNNQYYVRLGLKSVTGEEIINCAGDMISGYGFGQREFLLNWNPRYNVTLCGRVKIFCVIQKKIIISVVENLHPNVEDITNEEVADDEEKNSAELRGVDRLVQNLKKLFLDGQNSDAVLKTCDREFRVHKGILSARSPVFASMFQLDMTEKASGVVDIPDCTAESFENFLLYLYTGSADTMSQENVFNLYHAADKYHVDDLKAECVDYMKKTLSLDTFCDVIGLSLKHSESDLRKTATRFFCENMKTIVKTVQWQKYISDYPIHANELIIKGINA